MSENPPAVYTSGEVFQTTDQSSSVGVAAPLLVDKFARRRIDDAVMPSVLRSVPDATFVARTAPAEFNTSTVTAVPAGVFFVKLNVDHPLSCDGVMGADVTLPADWNCGVVLL